MWCQKKLWELIGRLLADENFDYQKTKMNPTSKKTLLYTKWLVTLFDLSYQNNGIPVRWDFATNWKIFFFLKDFFLNYTSLIVWLWNVYIIKRGKFIYSILCLTERLMKFLVFWLGADFTVRFWYWTVFSTSKLLIKFWL